jgi:hypothetical protein
MQFIVYIHNKIKIAKQFGHILGHYQTTIDPSKSIMAEVESLAFSFFFTSPSGIRAKLGLGQRGVGSESKLWCGMY